MKVRMAVVLAVLVLVAVSAVYANCDFQATCPMHSISARATGQTKRTDGGQHSWAEYHCPGMQSEAAHNFWVQCD
jgi:hypothetical protein